MKKIDLKNLFHLMGGKIVAADICTAMQNAMNLDAENWTDKFWAEWLQIYEERGCTQAVITPDMNRPN